MTQNNEAAAFLARLEQLPPGPGAVLDNVLQPSLDDEAELRKLFAQDRTNFRLSDPYVGLVNVFQAPDAIRTTRARIAVTEQDLSRQYVMPLSEERRRAEGSPCMAQNINDFKRNWSIFTEGSLSQLLDWNNVVAAGGAVQACLAPLPGRATASKRALRKHYHSFAYPSSDVDLFLYGLTPEQAEVKINAIYEAVRDSVPWDVTCIRTKHTVSIHSQYPYRSVQVVLRLYQSPAEILAGFDVDAPCCAYDGTRVWANPRAIVAMMRQCNTIDVTRRSPSYEVRLAKYASRHFEVYVPQLKREDIDPTIFERSIVRVQGLARLLVLEKLSTASGRDAYIDSRRRVRGRPTKGYAWSRRSNKRRYKGDLKDESSSSLEMSDYDVLSLHIPYGPGWDARRIDKLVYQTNKGRRLHRHPAFFGTMAECLEDCCEHCNSPKNDEERLLQLDEDKSYIRGRVQFIVEDPGRQSMSGSFNPIDVGEWVEQAYMGLTEKFFTAIASHDRAAVSEAVQQGLDVNRRDHVGRTPLQVAIMSKAVDIACDLVDANARMTARLVDGRTALHLAAQIDLPVMIRKLLDRSTTNAEAAEGEAARKKEEKARNAMDIDRDGGDNNPADGGEHDSSDDDWSSADDDDNDKAKAEVQEEVSDGNIPDDEDEEPDVFDLNVRDWDYMFSPLHYAIISGSVSTLELLIAAGADVKLVAKTPQVFGHRYAHPLVLTAVCEDEDVACRVAERLLAAGAVTSEADDNLATILHRMVSLSREKLVATFLRCDPNAKAVLNVPFMAPYNAAVFPIVTAVRSGSYSTLAVLLAHGAKLVISQDDYERARDIKIKNNQIAPSHEDFSTRVPVPLEVALAYYDEAAHLLVALGAEVNHFVREDWRKGSLTYLDYARLVDSRISTFGTHSLTATHPTIVGTLPASNGSPTASELPTWKVEIQKIIETCDVTKAKESLTQLQRQKYYLDEIKAYFEEINKLLAAHGAKTGRELLANTYSQEVERQKSVYPFVLDIPQQFSFSTKVFGDATLTFYRHSKVYGQAGMPANLVSLYDELFNACYAGNHVMIQQLCMPQSNHKTPDTPLQISCHWGNQWQGFTPLYLAVLARRWDTVKLILAIATAQYSRKEPAERKFETRDLVLDDGSDDDDDDSDEDDEWKYEEEPINFIDIAKRTSQIRVQVAPSFMLSVTAPFVKRDDNTLQFVSPIVKAIMNDDFEAFIQILNVTSALPDSALGSLITHFWTYDRPAMLDEYIRRTGEGIQIAQASGIDDDGSAVERSPKEYLGLNVHGKKRQDLAARGDPNAPAVHSGTSIPIVWLAVNNGLTATVRYLAGDQPLAAYRFYASSHSDQRAKLLQKIPDLAASLPAMLGWTVNEANESVLTATVVNNRADMLDMLLTLRPNEMQGNVHLRQRVYGFNNILAAARYGVSTKLLDLLLAKGISPMESDNEGRNVYHILCSQGGKAHIELLEHMLKLFPKDVTHTLLGQQTKQSADTPLHIAIKKQNLRIVKLLVQTSASQFLIRDSRGSTPLHVAVEKHNPRITRIVACAGPAEALVLEDGVGNTALEAVRRSAFEDKLRPACETNIALPSLLQPNWSIKPFNLTKHELELPRLKATMNNLLSEGHLSSGTKLWRELTAFVGRLEAKVASVKANLTEADTEAQDEVEDDPLPADLSTASATLLVLTKALHHRPGHRRLVHLSDVHRSVNAGLGLFAPESAEQPADAEDEEEGPKVPCPVLTNDYVNTSFSSF